MSAASLTPALHCGSRRLRDFKVQHGFVSSFAWLIEVLCAVDLVYGWESSRRNARVDVLEEEVEVYLVDRLRLQFVNAELIASRGSATFGDLPVQKS